MKRKSIVSVSLLIIFLLFIVIGCGKKIPKEIKFQVSDGYIQWQYEGDVEWKNIVAIDDLNKNNNGKSAYELVKEYGYEGTEKEWLDSLQGTDGISAYEIAVLNGFSGTEKEWLNSLQGTDGISAYEIAVLNGFSGTEKEWLDSLQGTDGKSAYEIAISQGYKGTEKEWLESLKGLKGLDGTDGENGQTGKSVYDIAKELGYPGTEKEWLETLKGDQGDNGYSPVIGENGNWWIGETDTNIRALERNMDRVGTDGLVFQLTIKNGVAGYEVCQYTGTSKDIVIPNLVFEKPVVSIKSEALPTSITSLSISSNTEYLPSFSDYSNLKTFDFNNMNLKKIPDNMFKNCSSLEIIMNYSTIKDIGSYAFYSTKLKTFDFTKIESIDSKAFYNCNYFIGCEDRVYNDLSCYDCFLYIPSTVKYIGEDAFSNADMVVYYEGESCIYSDEYLFTNVKHTTDGYYYKDCGGYASLLNYDGDQKHLKVPSTLDGKPLTTINKYAFLYNNRIERVELPSSVVVIGEYAFYLCGRLHSLFIPSSVNTFGEIEGDDYIFEKTTYFFEATTFDYTGGITSPSQLGLIKYMVGVKPSEIVDDDVCVYYLNILSAEVVTIKNKIGIITIPASIVNPNTKLEMNVSRINKYAMWGNQLCTFVKISDGISKISTNAFYNCGSLIMGINVPKSVKIVNYQGFYGLNSTIIYIEANVIPQDWDSSWSYSIKSYKLGTQAVYSIYDNYMYRVENDKVYLVKYLGTVEANKLIIIPKKIDNKIVYGIDKYCFYYSTTINNSTNRYSFVIPASVETMNQYSFYLYGSGYTNYYLNVSSIPSGWNYSWHYSTYGYNYNSGCVNIYYLNDWEYVDGIPTIK